jgi:hypothetical protein
MKVKALKKFEGIRDNERNVYPKEGDIWEVSEERANFLKEHGVVEIIEEVIGTIDYNIPEDTELKAEVKLREKPKKKKASKK